VRLPGNACAVFGTVSIMLLFDVLYYEFLLAREMRSLAVGCTPSS